MNSKKHYSSTTAILIFARSEKTESAIKPIASYSKQNVLLWKKMNDRVLRTIQKTYLPYFVSNENNQVGGTFGQKITHAIQAVFAKGFAKVIVVGNDCIELKPEHLLQAERDLRSNDWVFGADYNGGAYLIGVTKSEFKAEVFVTIPWQTKNAFTALQAICAAHSIAYLTCLNDFNDAFDFKKAAHKLAFSDTFKKILLSFLPRNTVQNHFETVFVFYDYHPFNFNKGSPFNAQISV